MSQEREEIRVNVGTGQTFIKSQEQLDAERDAETQHRMLEGDGSVADPDAPPIDHEMVDEYRALSREERKARLATVLDRGVVHERLKVDIPPHLHGEWVRRDPMDVDRMRTLGFWVDNQYATKRAIHSDGTSGNVVADVIFMVTTRDNKELIDEVRLEQQLRSARNPKEATEEMLEKHGVPGIIPTFSESKQHSLNMNDVRAALAKADGQVKVQR